MYKDDEPGSSNSKQTTFRNIGFSLIELIVAIAVLSLLIMTAKSSYSRYLDKTELTLVIKDIKIIEFQVKDFQQDNGFYPDTLAEIQINMIDPWGNPYEYLAIEGKQMSGKRRKDHSMVPINSDFDLYSMGKDGRSAPPLTSRLSKDDIVRGSNGKFIGLASDY